MCLCVFFRLFGDVMQSDLDLQIWFRIEGRPEWYVDQYSFFNFHGVLSG